jgi:hypothetical protein
VGSSHRKSWGSQEWGAAIERAGGVRSEEQTQEQMGEPGGVGSRHRVELGESGVGSRHRESWGSQEWGADIGRAGGVRSVEHT